MKIDLPAKKIVVLGGTGFVGTHLCAALVAAGHRVHVLSRNPQTAKNLTVLPTLSLEKVDVYQQAQLTKACHGADVVINLIGILNESGHNGAGFYKAHVQLAQKVITACTQNHIPRLLQMSALNAQSAKAQSFYLRTKGDAENYIHRHAPDYLHVTSFRPSVIFGSGDQFLNRFATLLRYSPGVLFLPVPNSLYAPIYVGDVVTAMLAALDKPETYGQRYDLCGPRVYTLKTLVEYVAELKGLHRIVIGLPKWLSKIQAQLMEYLPGKPFSKDNYLSTLSPSVCQQEMAAVLQLPLTSLESVAPLYLQADRQQSLLDKYRAQAEIGK